MRSLLLVAGLACLSGCATVDSHVAPQLVPAADVIRQVKYEIGKFSAETRAPVTTPGSCLANFALVIDRAEIDLTTTTSDATNLSAGAQVPINIVRLGVGAGVSSSRTNSQSLHLVMLPQLEDGDAPPPPIHPIWAGEPFYRAMMDIRSAIVAASDQRPCVALDPDNQLSFGFSAERRTNVNGSVGLFVLTLGADHSAGGTAAHSVTLHFGATKGAMGMVPVMSVAPRQKATLPRAETRRKPDR